MTLYNLATSESPIMDVPDVVALEQRIAAEGTPLSELMLRAGTALAQCAKDHCDGGKVLIICGSGNNGGDGWVAARVLAAAGVPVTLITPRPADQLRAEPARSAALETMEARLDSLKILVGEGPFDDAFEGNGIIVDCILGTGFNAADVKAPYDSWIRLANDAKGFKMACDAPSGLSAQTGIAAQPCFKADATITMLAVKTGLVEKSVEEFVGNLFLASLES